MAAADRNHLGYLSLAYYWEEEVNTTEQALKQAAEALTLARNKISVDRESCPGCDLEKWDYFDRALSALAQPTDEPVLYQMRMRPTWKGGYWTEWKECSPESYADYVAAPLVHDWQYEVRKLYVEPQAVQVAQESCGGREYCGKHPFCGCGSAPLFPERDPSKPAEQQGIFRKFDVRRADGSDAPGGKHYGCRYFVIDMDHDQHAHAALSAYGQACAKTHPQLSADLTAEFPAEKAERHVITNSLLAIARKLEADGDEWGCGADIRALLNQQGEQTAPKDGK